MLMRLFSKRPKPRPAIPPGLRVYAVGDIHGRADLLTRLLTRIEADARSHAGPAQLVYLGDYVDRGLQSSAVIDLLIRTRPPFQVHALKGNHEAALLEFLDDPGIGPEWCGFGGTATLLSYGVPSEMIQQGAFEAARIELLQRIPEEHVSFLRGLPVTHAVGDYLFVHAGLRPGVPLAEQSDRDLLWIRDDFIRSRADHGAVVVHGHTVSEKPEERENRIGIDTGAYATGVLTALVLEGEGRRFLQT